MTHSFEISVIIPVFNAGPFVTQAVESALNQMETGEVILIEDSSPDNSLEVCQSLSDKYKKVRLLRHPDGRNRGAAASRNLGMRSARFEYIAFLDADDFYLPDRFTKAKEVFKNNPDCGGVYEAIGTHIEDHSSVERWRRSGEMPGDLITMTKTVPPEELFKRLVLGGAGYFSPDGLVFRRNLLSLTGLMEENLRLHQDNEFIFRLAAVAKLLPGKVKEPVAMRRVHIQNRITAPRSQRKKFNDRLKMYKVSYRWFKKNSTRTNRRIILRRIIQFSKANRHFNVTINRFTESGLSRRFRLLLLALDMPEVILDSQYWIEYFPPRMRSLLLRQ